ncbi:M14 family metallopeptidase [Rubritalea marina]|uniref:M14 family metallopeptidase n=1 Tax=Rubritalea marina TaxID=361055 RepID=UPI000378C033|nr:M14 family metallocarboxypeptidase [Rubritalea marina]
MEVVSLIQQFDQVMQAEGAEQVLLAEVQGLPVYAYELVREGAERTCYLSAGMHGDEPASPRALLYLLRSGVLGRDVNWLICPILNPTGVAAGTRENFQGVDMNRDYLHQRTSEAKAHAAWLDEKEIDLMVSLHEDWESSGFYFYEINQSEDDPSRYLRIKRAVEAVMPMEPMDDIDGHPVRELGWIYHGIEADEPKLWPEAIYVAEGGCPLSFTLESPSSLPIEERVAAHSAALKEILSLCL